MTARPHFTSAEGLRCLLLRLHYSRPGAWRDDPEAEELMSYTMTKYDTLARKHQLEPADAAVAAFDVMRTRAVRTAEDPWAVITRAVQITLIYDARAQGLLCSTHQARRAAVSANHDAERFSDREADLADYHPAFRVPAEQDLLDLDDEEQSAEAEPTSAYAAVDDAVEMFTALGWPRDVARAGIDYVCARLVQAGSRRGAFESLRRDRHARALFDLSQSSWLALLRAVLGNPHRDRIYTSSGRGLLLRLLIGHQPADLFADEELVRTIAFAAPRVTRACHV